MTEKRSKGSGSLIERLDEVTQLADAMIQLPVRPSIPQDGFNEFEFFDVDGFTKYQDDLAPALRQKIKNLYPTLSSGGISNILMREIENAKTRLRYKNIPPSESDNHKYD